MTNTAPSSHEHYFALCALATTGSLTEQEWAELQSHLAGCARCRAELQEYREIARTGMALLMPGEAAESDLQIHAQRSKETQWTPQLAKRELFARIARGEFSPQRRLTPPVARLEHWGHRLISPLPRLNWRYAGTLAAAAVVIVLAYRTESRSVVRPAPTEQRTPPPNVTVPSMQAEIDHLKQLRDGLEHELAARDSELPRIAGQAQGNAAAVKELKRALAENDRTLAQQKAAAEEAQANHETAMSEAASRAAADSDALTSKLQEAQRALLASEKQLDEMREARSSELLRSASLQKRIDDLTARLGESDRSTEEMRQFLAADRDIRELMGARDLYIADVFDVAQSGSLQPPFGRIFYTRGKSLIFYAFDLDQQARVHTAATFQAWGRRGISDKLPLNLGIFYLDNANGKRWVLRFDDPRVLAQIDAVFVTVEPRPGNQKPSGKQLLFASLRTAPNHP